MYPDTIDLPNLTMSDCNLEFARAVSLPDDQIDVAYAALLYARDTYPDLNVRSYLVRLDDMAEEIRPLLADTHPSAVLRDVLYGKLGFRGNVEDYFDPRNSFLNQVLDRRVGIPITLSVLYLELAQRLKLPLVGIGLPGHFIVRYNEEKEPFYLDPFHGGIILSLQDCRKRIADISNGRLAFKPTFLEPVGPRGILTRMLRNLKAIYVARQEFESAVSVAEKLILLNPGGVDEIRDLGILHYYAGHKLKAIGCLEKYLEVAQDMEDLETVQHNLGVIISRVARWN
jgi:regulator of sirC expression with transglutaminase-like and TPR domain